MKKLSGTIFVCISLVIFLSIFCIGCSKKDTYTLIGKWGSEGDKPGQFIYL